jgi:fumarate reductase (CoM/CoB) subunit B
MSVATPNFAFDEREQKALRYCTLCPKLCRHACPVAHGEARETSTPWGLMRLLYLVSRGDVTADAEVHETLHRCVSCGRCQSFCLHDNPVAETLARGRAALVEAGMEVPEAYREGTERCRREARLRPRSEELREAPALRVSCGALASAADAARVERALGRLEAFGLSFRVLSEADDLSCGFHAWETGRPDRAAEAWDAFAGAEAVGPRVVTDCASGLWRARTQHAGVETAALHVVEWLAAHLAELPRGDWGATVHLHDSCFTTRRLGLGRMTRDVVGHLTGSEPRSLYESGRHAICCGAEGVWAAANPDAAGVAASALAEEARDCEASVLFTASTKCRAALQAQLGGAVRVVDIWDLVGDLPRVA